MYNNFILLYIIVICIALLFLERGHHLKTSFAQMGDPRSQWRLEGNRIVNQAGEVLDIAGRTNRDGAEIISYQDDSGSNQHWRLEYIN